MTHAEPPWLRARAGHDPRERSSVTISLQVMREYFSSIGAVAAPNSDSESDESGPVDLPRVRAIYIDDTGAIHDSRSEERIIVPGVSPDELLEALAEAERGEGRRLAEVVAEW